MTSLAEVIPDVRLRTGRYSWKEYPEPLQALICSYLRYDDNARIAYLLENPELGLINHPIFLAEPKRKSKKKGKKKPEPEPETKSEAKSKYRSMMCTAREYLLKDFSTKLEAVECEMPEYEDMKDEETSRHIYEQIRSLKNSGAKKLVIQGLEITFEELSCAIADSGVEHLEFNDEIAVRHYNPKSNKLRIPENIKILQFGYGFYDVFNFKKVDKLILVDSCAEFAGSEDFDCRILELRFDTSDAGGYHPELNFAIFDLKCPSLEELIVKNTGRGFLAIEIGSVLPKLRKVTFVGHIPVISVDKNSIKHLVLRENNRIPNLNQFPELETLEVENWSGYPRPLKLRELIITGKNKWEKPTDIECDLLISQAPVKTTGQPKLISTPNRFECRF